MKKESIRTKQIPILVTLSGAGLACLISVIQGVEFSIFFRRLLVSVIVFGIIGIAVRICLEIGFKLEREEEQKKASMHDADDVQITEGIDHDHSHEESDEDGQS